MRTIIIEDNPQVRELIKSFLTIYCPEVVVVGEAESVADGYGLLSTVPADLWLLDIELRDGTVFDLLNQLDPALFDEVGLVFITAYGTFENVIQALHKSAVDYLLKPVDPEQLRAAVQKVKKEASDRNLRQRLEALSALIAQSNPARPALEKLPVTLSKGIIAYLPLHDILYLEGESNICYVHLRDGKPVTSFKSLGEYSDILEKQGDFFKVHKKYLVNKQHLSRYDPTEGTVWLSNGKELVASRRGGRDLLAFFRGVFR